MFFRLPCRRNDRIPTLPLFIRIGINGYDQRNTPYAKSDNTKRGGIHMKTKRSITAMGTKIGLKP